MRRVLGLLWVVGMLTGCERADTLSDTGFHGAWTREMAAGEQDPAAAAGRSTIAVWDDAAGPRFRWTQSSEDGSVTVLCSEQGPCEAYAGGHKFFEYRFRAYRRDDLPDQLFVECTGAPVDPERSPLHYISRLELVPDKLELHVYEVERDGILLEGSAPRVFTKLSDDPVDGLRESG